MREDGNLRSVAKFLGISAAQLQKKAKVLGMPVKAPKKGKGGKKGTAAAAGGLPEAIAALECKWMSEALYASGGEVKEAAALIGMPRSRFYARMRKFDIEPQRGSRKAGRMPKKRDVRKAIAELEKKTIAQAIRDSGGHVREAAYRIGLNAQTMYRKMHRYKIKLGGYGR